MEPLLKAAVTIPHQLAVVGEHPREKGFILISSIEEDKKRPTGEQHYEAA
jgi:hypothetical protein